MTRWNAYLLERRTAERERAYLGEWTFVSSPKLKDSAIRAARKLEAAGDVVRVKEASSGGVYRTIYHTPAHCLVCGAVDGGATHAAPRCDACRARLVNRPVSS